MPQWWQLDPKMLADRFHTDTTNGLTQPEVERRLTHHGQNKLETAGGVSPLVILYDQFRDFMVLVLIAAASASWLLHEHADAFVILSIVVLNAVLGFYQEYRAERTLQALRKLSAPQARLRRDGHTVLVPAEDVVPGDMLLLEAGDRVPADARLIEAAGMSANEAALTGESMPVDKVCKALPHPSASIGDRVNMVYAGTSIVAGRGEGIVVATGMASEIGQIAGLIKQASPGATPLQQRLEQVGRWLILACLFVCGAVGAAGVIRGESVRTMFMAAVSLGVAAIPEGLPAVVTISLAIGVQRMVKRGAVVRRLAAVETFGCATAICSDKTGTLTRNEMTVTHLVAGGEHYVVRGSGYNPAGSIVGTEGTVAARRAWPHSAAKADPFDMLLLVGSACNNARLAREDGDWRTEGDPTEAALLVLAAKAGLPLAELGRVWSRRGELPFNSERKRMSVICRSPDGRNYLFVKGAADGLLPLCSQIYTAQGQRPLDAIAGQALLHLIDDSARRGLRLLAAAYRPLETHERSGDYDEKIEADLIFLGLFGLMDPPREESSAAVRSCNRAGIRTIMITGDHPLTALSVARQIGLLDSEKKVVTGQELDRLSDEELAGTVEQAKVYSRVSPRHKLRIVKALKAQGHVVAMTGDGVNDAPAVKEADIGVAMGRTGTDVTKEAASLVIMDDNFSTIVAAVEEGRTIYDNIRKSIRYLLGCNIGEILTMFLGMLMGLPLPLMPLQILWVNLITDGLPALALSLEPPEEDVMRRPPRPPRENLFSRGLWASIMWQGASIGLCTLVGFGLSLSLFPGQLARARTVAFTILVLSQLAFALVCRSETVPWRGLTQAGNPYLIWTVFVSFILHAAVIYLPWLSRFFYTAPLNILDWALVSILTVWSILLGQAYYPSRRFVRRASWKTA